MSYNGADAWPGYHPDPIAFHVARHRGYGRVRGDEDDPIRSMHVTLALWAGEKVPKLKGTRRKVRRWRLGGLLALERPLTPAEQHELDGLVKQHVAAKRRRKAPSETTDTERATS